MTNERSNSKIELDVLVVGSGVAGLSAAVRLATSEPSLNVGVLTKAALDDSTTRWAQGGVAAVLGEDEDSTDLHLADTLGAGAGLCDVDAVRVLVKEGPSRVEELITLGAEFDRQPGGRLSLAREGGHSHARVLHAGGLATGAEVERALVKAVKDSAAGLYEGWFALDLIIEAGKCKGVSAIDTKGEIQSIRAANVILATGGAGQVFSVTTNPKEATGDGIAMALRAGAVVGDLEFVQFHPTALHHRAMPRPLISEALRGHGALIRDIKGERFVDELAPRDVVSLAIAIKMAEQNAECMWLDATHLAEFDTRFPTIAKSLADIGLDPAIEWLPIAPAAHYTCGGVLTDLNGATTIEGLFAAGEVACTGVHGANRLASNSLLEGMVFAGRVSEAILGGQFGPERSGAMRAVIRETEGSEVNPHDVVGIPFALDFPKTENTSIPFSGDLQQVKVALQNHMSKNAGVVRDESSLLGAWNFTKGVKELFESHKNHLPITHENMELLNLAEVAHAIAGAALMRHESRGAHTRQDYPGLDQSMPPHRILFNKL
ncbi:MAG: L-aspartate oxidase [Acidimicrobiales bacterium]|nr:L-aspartate oxidase [Acidimicrobiales bacterium]